MKLASEKRNADCGTTISSLEEQVQLDDPVPDLALFARIVAAGILSAAGRELIAEADVVQRLSR